MSSADALLTLPSLALPCSSLWDDTFCTVQAGLNNLDYHVLVIMIERHKHFIPSLRKTDELKKVLQLMWNQLPQESVNKPVMSFIKDFTLI
jgi:hypothetical protein